MVRRDRCSSRAAWISATTFGFSPGLRGREGGRDLTAETVVPVARGVDDDAAGTELVRMLLLYVFGWGFANLIGRGEDCLEFSRETLALLTELPVLLLRFRCI